MIHSYARVQRLKSHNPSWPIILHDTKVSDDQTRATTPGDPVYVYDPVTGKAQTGYQGRGVVVLAVDNLPSELPRESSAHFSETLLPFVPEIAHANYEAPLEQSGLSDTIKRAVIAWQGRLTPDFEYLTRFL